MSIRLQSFELKAASEKPAASDLAILSDPDFAGADVAAEDVITRRMLLCHDQYDRTFERFPKEYLQRFAETLPGKSVLPGHDTGALPLARFFKARVSRVDEQEFPVLTRRERKSAEEPAGFELKPARVSYLDAGFYYGSDDASLDKKIKLGVYRSVSIGFRFDDVMCDVCNKSYFSDCPHLAGRWDDGKLTTLTYGGDAQKAEALEGSIVYLGAQPQARIQKQAGDMVRLGQVDPEKLALVPLYGEIDPVTLKWGEALAREHGHQRKSWAFPALEAKAADPEPPAPEEPAMLEKLRKLFGLADTATEDEVFAAAEKAKAEATPLEGRSEFSEIKLARETAEAKAASLEPLAKIGETALGDLAKGYLDHCLRLEQPEVEAKALADMFVSKQDYAGLKTLVDAKWKQVCEKFPAGPSGDVNAGQEQVEAEKPKGRPQDHQLF